MHRSRQIARLISAAYRHQLAYLSRNLTPFHLGGGSYIYLLMVVENPGISQAELSSRLVIDRATVSKMLAYLEREEMIRRSPHPHDKRLVLLHATPSGKKIYESMTGITADYCRMMLDGISEEDQDAALRTLQRILENLKRANQQDKNLNKSLQK